MGKIIGALIGVVVGIGLFLLFHPTWVCWLGALMAAGSLLQFIRALWGDA